MRRALLLLPAVLLTWSARASAEDVPGDLSRLVLDTGRVEPTPPDPDLARFQLHGEYQLRYQQMRSFPLDPTASFVAAHASRGTAIADSLGQNGFASHWLRATPRLQIGSKLTIVGQIDVLTGTLLGDTAHDTSADQTPRNDYDGVSNVQPRWLYLEWLTPVGLLRVGQQPSHWGMGILANDGDHPPLFGDYRYGNIVEQVLFATKPLGDKSPFVVALAGDLVYRDNVARLTRGDHAWQAILAAFYEQGADMLGLYSVYRHQTRDREAAAYSPYADTVDVFVADVAGHFARPVEAPARTAFVFGSFEAAALFGSTNAERTVQQARSGDTTAIRSYGGAAALGVVLAGDESPGTAQMRAQQQQQQQRPDLYGKVVAQVEVGYASGDADPYDDVEKRFVFDPNHRVGLLLFDEVMRWQTARAATAAQDPLLSNGTRPPPGVDLLPSNGGVFGAEYVYPTAIYRPRPWLDLKWGAVVAQTTADVADPYRVATKGAYVNYRGGDPRRHDLGVELDAGAEARVALDYGMKLQIGAQGGMLFPGGALADASGVTMKVPWIVVGRGGLQF